MESKASAPQTMWQVVVDKPGHQNIDCRRVPIPQLKKDEVLIKVLAAPINPRDYYIMLAKDLPFPLCPGDQGSGVVVRSGGGFSANRLVGKRVAFLRLWTKHETGPPNGSYSEYCVVRSNFAFQIDKSVSHEQAACTLINPVSALGLMERLKQLKARTVVQTGAASTIAKMMIRLAPSYNMRFINIVRRQEQVDTLKEEFKQEFVLNSNDEDFLQKFNALAHDLNARHCLECVSGEMTGNLLNNMPDESTVIVYGSLSLSRIGNINPRHFIYKAHKIEGFVLTKYVKDLSLFGKYMMFRKLKSLLNTSLSSSVSREFGLHELKQAIEYYDKNQSAGKVMMKASLIPEDYPSKL